MSTLSSANVTDVNLVLKERTHMRLCLNMLIFTHNLGNWLIKTNMGMKAFTDKRKEKAYAESTYTISRVTGSERQQTEKD